MEPRLAWAAAVTAGLWLCGCYHPAHCQSGSKHGTECYTQVGDDPPVTDEQEEEQAPPRNPVPPTTPR